MTFEPVAIIDIGSNSVRLVAYDGLQRASTPLYNEKVLCGLGRSVFSTGRLNEDSVQRALTALRRFRVLCDTMRVSRIFVLATAAARDAANGPAFLEAAREALGQEIQLLSGRREAELSALGVVSGFYAPDGVVGDLGGGSLELVDVNGTTVGQGVTMPLGGLALQDLSEGSLKKARKIAREHLKKAEPQLDTLRGRTFYAVGGTWRALARLHQAARDYPLHVMHGYAVEPSDELSFLEMVEASDAATLQEVETISEARRPLLAFGAVVLEEIIRLGRPREIAISAFGVREGLLFEQLDRETRLTDPLIASAQELNLQRARSPATARSCATGPTTSSPASTARRPRASAACATRPACSRISAGEPIPITAASRASTCSPTPPSPASTIPGAPISRCRVISATRAWLRRRRARPCACSPVRACSTAPASSAP
ncbi:hypothetical protein GCM10025880_50290 [Methylorubrum aminovorans]|nr:hypothetical protein GCM10025880_50290 [Methylorubrum aminovorans]